MLKFKITHNLYLYAVDPASYPIKFLILLWLRLNMTVWKLCEKRMNFILGLSIDIQLLYDLFS